jgi:hypothetical protein
MVSLNLFKEKEAFLYPIEEINKESWFLSSLVINSKIPFSSDIIPLLFEKYTVA